MEDGEIKFDDEDELEKLVRLGEVTPFASLSTNNEKVINSFPPIEDFNDKYHETSVKNGSKLFSALTAPNNNGVDASQSSKEAYNEASFTQMDAGMYASAAESVKLRCVLIIILLIKYIAICSS